VRERRRLLVNCPNCGTKQATAVKNWTITPIKRAAAIITPEIHVGTYECPKCKVTFKSAMPVETVHFEKQQEQTVTVLIGKLTQIRLGLIQNLNNLRRNLEVLESERSGVLFEIGEFKRDAESKAVGLESEVNDLREDIRCLRDLLGLDKDSS
jgi:hypothetical protein